MQVLSRAVAANEIGAHAAPSEYGDELHWYRHISSRVHRPSKNQRCVIPVVLHHEDLFITKNYRYQTRLQQLLLSEY
jgi:hypothetical protein